MEEEHESSSHSRSSSAASGSSLRANYISLQAAHQSLLARIQSEEDDDREEELVRLRQRVTKLQDELAKSRTEKEELSGTVRDLRSRVEEGRRAIMRLQGAGSGGASGSSATGSSHGPSTNVSIGGASGNRRSMGPSAFSSWNPREVFNGASSSPEDDAASQTDESKKSKRASLAFGPSAGSRIVHRRTASGGRGTAMSEVDGSGLGLMSPPTTTPGGLRELRLSGPAGNGSSIKASGGDSSKRSSFISGLFSPASETSELPSTEEPTNSGAGSLLSAGTRAVRRTSNSSSISASALSNDGGAAEAGGSSLGLPGFANRNSASPAPSSVHSPIIEDGEGEEVEVKHRGANEGDEDPSTAKANVGSPPTFATMQAQQQISFAQRNLQEQTERLKDRDRQLAELRGDLSKLRMELDEAKEARAASENCLRALREFVRDEASNDPGGSSTAGGEGVNDAMALRGVKLPPLPTDKDDDDARGEQSSDGTPLTPQNKQNMFVSTMTPTASTWKNIGSTFSGFTTRKQSVTSPPVPPVERRESQGSNNEASTGAVGLSLGSLWSRSATTPASETGPNLAGGGELEKTTSASSSAASTAGVKGLGGWFGKAGKSTSVVSPSSEGLPPPPMAAPNDGRRISSPPFANLDNNVITLFSATAGDDAAATTSRPESVGNSSNGSSSKRGTLLSPGASDMEPNGRVKKMMEKTKGVDEDEGFVPPTF